MSSNLCLHRGAHIASLEEIAAVPLPEETSSYKPLPHYEFTIGLLQTGRDILESKGMKFQEYRLALDKDGQRLFGLAVFTNGTPDMSLSIGFRNSYDKSMVAGIAVEGSVFICDNLALSGEFVIARKHTGGILSELEEKVIVAFYKTHSVWRSLIQDTFLMKDHEITDDEAHKLLGLAYGRKLIKARQLPKISHGWRQAHYEEFASRNLWSLYNSITEVYKTLPIEEIVGRHVQLHKFMKEIM